MKQLWLNGLLIVALLVPVSAFAARETVNLYQDDSKNTFVTQGTLTACEDQTNNLCQVRERPFTTYTVSNVFTPPATPTDMITVTGSASKTVKVWSLRVCTTNTLAGSQEFRLIKRSTADTGGTAVASTLIPQDSASAAVTATVNHYTANPGALGTAVGTLNIVRWSSPVAVPGAFATNSDACQEILPNAPNGQSIQPVVLRGIAEQLAVNFNGAALVAGQTHAFRATVSEE